MRKRISIIPLTIILLFSSCGISSEDTKMKNNLGRYIEEEIGLPLLDIKSLTLYDVELADDNSYLQITGGGSKGTFSSYRVFLTPAVKAEPLDVHWSDGVPEPITSFYKTRFLSDGRRYITDTSSISDNKIYVQETADSKFTPLNLQYPGSEETIGDFYLLDSGDFLLRRRGTRGGQLEQYDLKDGSLRFTYSGNFVDAQVVKNTVAALDASDRFEGKLRIFNTIDGSEIRSVAYPDELRDVINAKISFINENEIAVGSSDGIYTLSSENDEWTKVIDGGFTSLLSPELKLNSFFALPNEEYLMLCISQEGLKLFKYHYSPDVLKEPLEKLTVGVYGGIPSFIELAANEMRQKNADCFVDIVEYGFGDVPRSEVMRIINTELLAGKGTDIYELNDLPIQSYLEKGVFVEISDIVELERKQNLYYQNILDTHIRDGKLFVIPIGFSIPMMAGSQEYMSNVLSLKHMADWAETHKDPQLLYNMDYVSLFFDFAPFCYPAWFDQYGDFQTAVYEEFLNEIQRLSKCGIGYDENLQMNYGSAPVYNKQAQIMLEDLYTPEQLSLYEGIFNNDKLEWNFGQPAGQLPREQYVYRPEHITGINKNSSQLELAKQFISLLLSEEIQKSLLETNYSLPILRSVMKKELEQKSYFLRQIEGIDGKNSLDIDEWMSPSTQKAFLEYLEKLNTPYLRDAELLSSIFTESEDFFIGKKTAKDTAEAINSRIQAMLAE